MTDRIEVLCEDDLQSRLPPDECVKLKVMRTPRGILVMMGELGVKVSRRDQRRLAEFFAEGEG